MGLDLVCGRHRLRAGSYSGVVKLWTALLRAYLLFLREAEPRGLTNDMDVALQRVENRRTARRLEGCLNGTTSYDETGVRLLSRRLHPGMRHLLLGTASQGRWTPYQARDILSVLKRLRPFFLRIPELCEQGRDDFFLEPILRRSVRDDRDVVFV